MISLHSELPEFSRKNMDWSFFSSYRSNLWKYFLFLFTSRRNFIPILSIYYMTLPDAHASEVGIYTGIGFLTSFLLQIPSGMLADRIGEKNTLIIAKIFLLFSSVCFVFGVDFLAFILGSIFLSVGTAFYTGASSSFLKATLEKLGRGNEYRFISSKIGGNVSLFSVLFIVGLPFLTDIDMRLPIFVGLFLDIIGLIAACILIPVHMKSEKSERKTLRLLLREVSGTRFFSYAFFAGTIAGFLMADSAYRSLYLTELGYPIIYIGFVMGMSRVVWWLVGNSVHRIERYFSLRNLLLFDTLLFSSYYIFSAFVTNPWILGVCISLVVGWLWGRSEIYTDLLIDRIPDKKYRATLLSVRSQIENIIQVIISFSIAGVMAISYSLGFFVLGVVLFFALGSVYFFFLRKDFL